MVPLHHSPAVVLTAEIAPGDVVDLFPAVLSHVGDVQITVRRIEARAPGIPQAIGPDLVAVAADPVRERVVGRHAIGRGRPAAVRGQARGGHAAHVHTQQLAEQRAAALSVAARAVLVPGAPPVTGRNVQVAVGAELQLPAVVVALRLLEAQQALLAVRVGDAGVRHRHHVARHHGEPGAVQRPLGVIDVEQTAGRIVGVERHSQQTHLVERGRGLHLGADVQEGRKGARWIAALLDPDEPVLLDHEQTVGVARRRGHEQRSARQAGDHRHGLQGRVGRRSDTGALRRGRGARRHRQQPGGRQPGGQKRTDPRTSGGHGAPRKPGRSPTAYTVRASASQSSRSAAVTSKISSAPSPQALASTSLSVSKR